RRELVPRAEAPQHAERAHSVRKRTDDIVASVPDHHRLLGGEALDLHDVRDQLCLVRARAVELAAVESVEELRKPEVLDDPYRIDAGLRRREEQACVARDERLERFGDSVVYLVLEEADRSEAGP